MKKIGSHIIIAVMAAFFVLLINNSLNKSDTDTAFHPVKQVQANPATTAIAVPMIDFTVTAERTTPAVVHIKTKVYTSKNNKNTPFHDIFGNEMWGHGRGGARDFSQKAPGSLLLQTDLSLRIIMLLKMQTKFR